MQTATGTKDKIAQHWIEVLLQKSHKMKMNKPTWPIASIVAEVKEWFEAQPGDKMNLLLSIDGIFLF